MQLMMIKGLPSQLTSERITGNADRFHMDEAGEQRNVPVRHKERQLSDCPDRGESGSPQPERRVGTGVVKNIAVLRITDASGPGSSHSQGAPCAPYTEIPVTY